MRVMEVRLIRIIRSSWGQGRIPVLVDDTEQAITIWRGYSGVSNRN